MSESINFKYPFLVVPSTRVERANSWAAIGHDDTTETYMKYLSSALPFADAYGGVIIENLAQRPDVGKSHLRWHNLSQTTPHELGGMTLYFGQMGAGTYMLHEEQGTPVLGLSHGIEDISDESVVFHAGATKYTASSYEFPTPSNGRENIVSVTLPGFLQNSGILITSA